MARFSREEKRQGGVPVLRTAPETAPIEVRVPAAAGHAGGPAAGASVDGVPVEAADGEDIRAAVLRRLHRAALACGRPVLATVHDEHLGYVVPLRVDPDGSSHLAGEPAPAVPRTGPKTGPRTGPKTGGRATPPAAAADPPADLPADPSADTPGSGSRPRRSPCAPCRSHPRAPRRPRRPPPRRPTPDPGPRLRRHRRGGARDEPLTAPGDRTTPALLAEPTARVNEAVKEGRTEEAARLAEQAVEQASRTLGPEHAEVLRLRELMAYIAYLSGDPDRAHVLSLELARLYRRAGDAEAAYGNVQSAATAWRAVRDPSRGLELGRDLIALWTELTAEEGPAADDIEQLESARARMDRLTERARAQNCA